MKRVGRLADKIGDMENLRWAFLKASCRSSGKRSVAEFRENLEENLQTIRKEWLAGTLKAGKYFEFTIYDPKERKIHAPSFRDRVVQHAIMNVCDKVFEDAQIFDSYASRRGKGVDACLARTEEFARKFKWFVKFDIHKFFDSVDHGVLKAALLRRFKDKFVLHYFFDLIDGYETSRGRGIPIGSLASQYFANLYLAGLDRFCKETLRVRGYVRYMDDFVLFFESFDEAKEARERVAGFVSRELKMDLNPVVVNTTEHGISFLSYRICSHGTYLSRKAKERFVRKMRIAESHEDAASALSLLAFVRRAKTHRFRRNLFFGSDSKRLEPRESRRELEQQRAELSLCESQQQFARQPQQQPRLPCCLIAQKTMDIDSRTESYSVLPKRDKNKLEKSPLVADCERGVLSTKNVFCK